MNWKKWKVAVGGAALVTLTAVGVWRARASHGTRSEATALSVVPSAPQDLLAEFVLPTPNASWSRLQNGIGGPAAILPPTVPALLSGLAELDERAARELDGASSMYGVVAGTLDAPAVVLAVKVLDLARARTLFAPHDAASANKVAVELGANGYVLIARRHDEIARLGAYVTQALPVHFADSSRSVAATLEIPHQALAGVVAPTLDARWKELRTFLLTQDEKMRSVKGRAPDVADPAAIVAALDDVFGRRLAIASDLEKVRVVFDVTDEQAAVTATLEPRSGNGVAKAWIDGMSLGGVAPLLDLPSASVLAFAAHGSTGAGESPRELEQSIVHAVGSRIPDPQKLHDVFESVAKFRGDRLALAVTTETSFGLFMRTPARDRTAAEGALKGAFALAKEPPFRDVLGVDDVVASTEQVDGLGKVDGLTLTRKPTTSRVARSPKRIGGGAYAWDKDDLVLGLGPEPLAPLKEGSQPRRKLADEPTMTKFASAMGTDGSLFVVAQPLRIDPKRASFAAPLALGLGRRSGRAFVRLEFADVLLRELAKAQLGL